MARRSRPRSFRPYLAFLALAAAPAMGCSFQPGELSGDPNAPPDGMSVPDDAAGPMDGPGPIDAPLIDARPAPDAGPPPDAAPLPGPGELVRRGLLTRFFIDEDSEGSDVSQLDDSTPDEPLPLTIEYANEGEFIEDTGNRGLRWNAITQQGKASASLAEDGKVWTGLGGSTTGTIELVVDVDEFQSGSRLSHIGEADDSGVFTLRVNGEPEGFAFYWNNADGGQIGWNAGVDDVQRAVLHVVFDSGQANPAERVSLFVNGTRLVSTSGSPPGQNEAIDIVTESATVFALGNTAAGGRGVRATFYYASMYSAALSPAEVAHNMTILISNDDGPDSGE